MCFVPQNPLDALNPKKLVKNPLAPLDPRNLVKKGNPTSLLTNPIGAAKELSPTGSAVRTTKSLLG